MTRLALLPIAVLAVLLTGCSQIAAIAPVGGARLSEVRYATNDVLVDREVGILTAPVCTEADDHAVMCEGETIDGETITAVSPADDQASLTITIGDEQLFTGDIQTVLDDAMRPGS